MVRAVVRRGRRDGLFDGGRRLQGRLPSDVVRRVVRRVCGRHFLDRRALLQRRLPRWRLQLSALVVFTSSATSERLRQLAEML